MTEARAAAMTATEFVDWSVRQSGGPRHELVDGVVVTMSTERAIHARTKYAVSRCLEQAIAVAGLACEAFVDGMAVRIDEATVFEPDALVRRGDPLDGDATLIDNPVIVIEVASPSPQRVDALLKLTRYFDRATIEHTSS